MLGKAHEYTHHLRLQMNGRALAGDCAQIGLNQPVPDVEVYVHSRSREKQPNNFRNVLPLAQAPSERIFTKRSQKIHLFTMTLAAKIVNKDISKGNEARRLRPAGKQ